MNHEYFIAQDQVGNRQKVQVLGLSDSSADSGIGTVRTVYALEDGSAVERVDTDTFRIIGSGALVTVVRE